MQPPQLRCLWCQAIALGRTHVARARHCNLPMTASGARLSHPSRRHARYGLPQSASGQLPRPWPVLHPCSSMSGTPVHPAAASTGFEHETPSKWAVWRRRSGEREKQTKKERKNKEREKEREKKKERGGEMKKERKKECLRCFTFLLLYVGRETSLRLLPTYPCSPPRCTPIRQNQNSPTTIAQR